jgi:putative ATPase
MLGYEAGIHQQVVRRREAQLAAMIEVEQAPTSEVLPLSPSTRARDRWLQRTISKVGEQLGVLRDRILEAAALQRHSLVLDLNAATGLLTWEALRRTPEGGVWALSTDAAAGEALRQQAERLPAVERPVILVGELLNLPTLLAAGGNQEVHFDAIVGRNALTRYPDKTAALACLHDRLAPGGRLALAEVVPRQAQRLSALGDVSALDRDLVTRWRAAEEAMYQTPDDPLVNWDVPALEAALRAAGFCLTAPLQCVTQTEERYLTTAHLDRWCTRTATRDRPSYAQRVLTFLSVEEWQSVEACLRPQLQEHTVPWQTTLVYITATPSP